MSQRDTFQRSYGNHQSMEYHQAVQTPGGEGNRDKGESSHYPRYSRTAEPDRAYSDSFRPTGSRPTQLSSGFTPFRHQQISGQESPLFIIPERVRPNDPESVALAERSTQDPEIVGNNSRISSPNNRNITPTWNKYNVVTPESSSNSDAQWLQMSQFAEKTKKQFPELQESHVRMEKLAASMDKIVKPLQEGCDQLSKASEEANRRLNKVLEEKHHCKRNRDCLGQDLNKFFNVYKNMKPQPQGHSLDNLYQEEIKPDVLLDNQPRSPSQYQDGYNMTYSEKEELKKLTEASSWSNFSVVGEYDHMELIYYIDGLFIDVPSIPEYWINARLKTELKGHPSIWYTEMKEIHGRRNWPWWKSQIIQNYIIGNWILQKTMSFENDKYSVDKDPYEWCLRQSKRLKAIDHQMNIQMSNHKLLTQIPGELENAIKCKGNQRIFAI
ncbi:hypothetical protein O181_002633 [Austropuccinia psidii MF-1]|uniref:Uncharacterized protein n=1 Tax=Austropuccinia psidii MF-1 TaxID=1389203 RepID=A0A9Q3BCV7_9BASI|nr:hypothetical protein [Austropuccinia psidii MF-1]